MAEDMTDNMLERSADQGHPQWVFAASSGVTAGFSLAGDPDDDSGAEGEGSMSIHGLEIAKGAARVSSRRALIETHFSWGAERFALFLAPEHSAGGVLTWYGSATLEERLQCAATPDFPMQIRMTVEASPAGTVLSAGAEVETIAREAEIRPRPGADLTGSIAELRGSLLRNLRQGLEDAVDELEFRMPEWKDEPVGVVASGPAPPAAAIRAPETRGYLSTGYLPRSGYLSRPGGYLGHLRPAHRPNERTMETTRVEDDEQIGEDDAIWRIARLKDLLYAIELPDEAEY